MKINRKGKRTVPKANKGINVEKIIKGLKIKKREKKLKSLIRVHSANKIDNSSEGVDKREKKGSTEAVKTKE